MDPIANMLTIIKNAQAVGHKEVLVPFSRLKLEIARILAEKGFIEFVQKRNKRVKKSERNFLSIILKYEDGAGAINGIKLMSKQSRRLYVGKKALHKVKQGHGISILSTSKGVMEGEDARKAGVGGELLFEIW